MVRIVASLRFRLRDTTQCTASTGDGPASQTACITSFSNSVKGARTKASLWLRLDMARSVPLHDVTVKRILNQTDGRGVQELTWAEQKRARARSANALERI